MIEIQHLQSILSQLFLKFGFCVKAGILMILTKSSQLNQRESSLSVTDYRRDSVVTVWAQRHG